MNQNAANNGGRNDERPGALHTGRNKKNPAPRPDVLSIIALVKRSGRVSGYQLSDGSRVTREQGVQMAKEGNIQGVSVAVNQGTEYLRALPDAAAGNNLSNLPSVTAGS